MSVILQENQNKKREKVGLKDGGHVTLRCSKCDKPIAYVWIVKEDKDSQPWQVTAECPYGCQRSDGKPERSFIEEIYGRFAPSGYHKPIKDNPDEVIPITHLTKTEIEGQVVVLGTKKHEN